MIPRKRTFIERWIAGWLAMNLIVVASAYRPSIVRTTSQKWTPPTKLHAQQDKTSSRRQAVFYFGSLGTALLSPDVSRAAMQNSQNVFKAGVPISIDLARERFLLGQQSLGELISNYSEISKGGGDNVRRYIGTVGTSSGLYGIDKVLNVLAEEAEDFVEFKEAAIEFSRALAAAEGAAYQSIFVATSSSSVPPEKYLEDARQEAKRMQSYMDIMAKQLKL